VAQMALIFGDVDKNLKKVEEFVIRAKAKGADIIVFPETADVGWMTTPKSTDRHRIPDGDACQKVCELSKSHEIFICIGLSETEGSDLYNTAILVSDEGVVLAKHRKINEREVAKSVYKSGDQPVVVETRLGHIGIMICADGLAIGNTIARALCEAGASLILSPCCWALPKEFLSNGFEFGDKWIKAYSEITKEYNVPIVAANCLGDVANGPWQGRVCIGNSMYIIPKEKPLLGQFGDMAEELMISEVPINDRLSASRLAS